MFIGRQKETEILKNACNDEKSHFIAVYGRRRIGKTYLVRETFGYRFTFQHTGLYQGNMKSQLFAFSASLKDSGFITERMPENWMEAFEALKDLIRGSGEKKKIIFLDELSWMDTRRSDLMMALEHFWNGWASARKDIVLIICTSATSWMISNVIHNKGGLYNRLTEQIELGPFCLSECEEYVKAAGLVLNRNQILQCYMIMGGVPYYWGFLQKGLSVQQNIDKIFFAKDAPLRNEYHYLYSSVFANPEPHLRIIEALGKKRAGMTREELIEATGLPNSGFTTMKLEELEYCGFIRKYASFGKKKRNAVYQLIDFFTLFYYRFMEQSPTDERFWSNQINTPAVNTWMGLAFERVCLKHIAQIKNRLGISGVLSEECSWYCRKDPDKGVHGSQIDLLIVRRDSVINLCEMKYSQSEYAVTQALDESLRHKINDFLTEVPNGYSVFPTLVTTYGLVENSYSGDFQSVVTADDLFREV